MSSRPLIAPKTIINSVSMATDITGTPTIIQMTPGISYDISWTGTPTGTFQIQVSNSYKKSDSGGTLVAGNWTVLPTASFSGTYPAATGSAGNGFIDVVGTEAYAVRLVYVAGSGAGNLTVVECAKVL